MLQLGNYVLPMITLPIISRIIGPEKYGEINFAYAFVGYFILFINAGFDFYGMRKILEYNGNKERINHLFSRITIAKSILLIISAILFISALYLIPQVSHARLVNLFTFLLCIGWVINPSWLYNGMQDARNYAFFSFLSKLLFSIAVVVVIKHQNDYIYQPLLTGLAHVIVSFVSLKYAMKHYNIRFHLIGWEDIKKTFRENKHLSLIWWFTNQSASTSILIAGLLLSTLSVGMYSAAFRLIIIIQAIISMPLNTVLFPYIGEAYVVGRQPGLIRVNKTLPYVCLIAAVITMGTFLLAKPVILLFYGHQFAAAVRLLKIISLVLFFNCMNATFGQQILLHLKQDTTYLKFIISGFVLNVVLIFGLTYLYGLTGATAAWPLAEIIIFIGYLSYFRIQGIHKDVNLNYFHPRHLYYYISNLLKFNVMFYFVKKPWWLKLLYGDCLWHMDPREKVLYLTFDDGPHPRESEYALEQLKKYNASATFFCIGSNVKANMEQYNKLIASGHSVGNHTNHHLDGWKTNLDKYIEDIKDAGNVIKSPLFRPPYGHISRKGMRRVAKNLKLQTIMWSVMSGDFDQQTSEERCLENVIKNAEAGSIIVFHDCPSAFKNMKYALPRVLDHFTKLGYEFRSIKAA